MILNYFLSNNCKKYPSLEKGAGSAHLVNLILTLSLKITFSLSRHPNKAGGGKGKKYHPLPSLKSDWFSAVPQWMLSRQNQPRVVILGYSVSYGISSICITWEPVRNAES